MTMSDADETTEKPVFSNATLLGLPIALLALPLLSVISSFLGVRSPAVSIGLQWCLLAVILYITCRWEDRPLHSIGIRRPKPIDTGYLLAATLLGFFALATTGPLVDALGLTQAEQTGLGVAEAGVGLALLSAVTTGVVEELLYRGYAIERLDEYTDSAVLAGAISWSVFTLAHAASWRPGDLLQVSLAALVFTLIYLQRRSLVPVIGAHILIWILGILGTLYG